MKLLYVIAQGHTGSTLMDTILGTHPDLVSSGELRYLNWQLLRTQKESVSVKNQNVCTCGSSFPECEYWSKVIRLVEEQSHVNIAHNPLSFDTAYFNQFSYGDRGGKVPSLLDKAKSNLFRRWVGCGFSYKRLLWLEPRVEKWIRNNWLLYESMARTANKPVIVDSSKHLLIALLLQQYQPEDVYVIFIHRSIQGLAASAKRRAGKKGMKCNLRKVVEDKKIYEARVSQLKSTVRDLQFLDVSYEDFVSHPASFLERVVNWLGIARNYLKQKDDAFYVDPSKLHLVAGNPMRYKGRQLVKYDDRWKSDLTAGDLVFLENLD